MKANTRLFDLMRKAKISLFCMLGSLAMLPVPAWAAPDQNWKVETILGITIEGGPGKTPLTSLVGQLLNVLYGFAGVSAVLMIIYGAYRYISAAGNPKQVQEAKDIIQSAVYGLLIILLAYIMAATLGDILGAGNMFTDPGV